jgi:hypothetical protein
LKRLSRTSLIWIKTLLTTGLDVGLAAAIFMVLGRIDWPTSIELRGAVALTIFLMAAILVMAASLTANTILELLRQRRRLKYRPSIHESLAAELVTGGQMEQLKRFARKCPAIVSQCICAELSCITGSAHRHISEVSCDLGLLQRWSRQLRSWQPLSRCRAVRLIGALEPSMTRGMLIAALNDESEQVRIEAGRALVRWAIPMRSKRF